MLLTSLSKTFLLVPNGVRLFLVRALFVFVAWKLLYHLWLFPIQIPDRPLRDITAQHTAWLYNFLPGEQASLGSVTASANTIRVAGSGGINIANGCNGLELFVTYLGFLFCYRSGWKRQVGFALVGVAFIYILNVLRCFGLVWLISNGSSLADFAHHYLFKMIIYSVIFGMWMLYTGRNFQYVR